MINETTTDESEKNKIKLQFMFKLVTISVKSNII